MKNRLNETGYGLVAVLATTAVMAMIGMAMGQMLRFATKGTAAIHAGLDYDALRTSVRRLISKDDTCGVAFRTAQGAIASFGGAGASNNPFKQIVLTTYPSGTTAGATPTISIIAKEGQKLSGGATLSAMFFRYPAGITGPTPKGAQDEHQVELILEASRGPSGPKMTNVLSPYRLTLLTNHDTKRIEGCSEQDSKPSGLVLLSQPKYLQAIWHSSKSGSATALATQGPLSTSLGVWVPVSVAQYVPADADRVSVQVWCGGESVLFMANGSAYPPPLTGSSSTDKYQLTPYLSAVTYGDAEQATERAVALDRSKTFYAAVEANKGGNSPGCTFSLLGYYE